MRIEPSGMQIDWSTATVPAPQEGEPFALEVDIRGPRDRPFQDAFDLEAAEMGRAVMPTRRDVEMKMSAPESFRLQISPIDVGDLQGEAQMLEGFMERVNRAAEETRAIRGRERLRVVESHRRAEQGGR